LKKTFGRFVDDTRARENRFEKEDKNKVMMVLKSKAQHYNKELDSKLTN